MTTEMPVWCCGNCESDLVVWANKEKDLVRCLDCSKTGRPIGFRFHPGKKEWRRC